MRRTVNSSNARWNPDDVVVSGDFGGLDAAFETRSGNAGKSRRSFIAGGVAFATAAAVGGMYVAGRDYAGDLVEGIQIRPSAACAQPGIVVPVLIDGTETPFATAGQVAEIRRQLMDIAQSVPRGSVIEFYTLTTSEFSPIIRILSECQPGRPDEAVWWRESKHELADGHDGYLTRIRSHIDSSVVSVKKASETPLVQGIIEVFRSCRERFPHALIDGHVYSDLLHHKRRGPSAYVSNGGQNDILAQGRNHPLFPQQSMSNAKLTLRVIGRGSRRTRYGKTFDEQQSGMASLLRDTYGELTGQPVSVVRIT